MHTSGRIYTESTLGYCRLWCDKISVPGMLSGLWYSHALGLTFLVQAGHDGLRDVLQLPALVLVLVRLRQLVAVQPGNGLINSLLDPLLVLRAQLGCHL